MPKGPVADGPGITRPDKSDLYLVMYILIFLPWVTKEQMRSIVESNEYVLEDREKSLEKSCRCN